MSTRLGLASLASALLAAACSAAPQAPVPLDLRAALGPDVQPTGVAVDPTGARFLFDEHSGLYRLDGDTFTMVMPRDGMPATDVPVRPPFTDLVAIGPEQFALTALGDGYKLDTALGTMRQYFCYVPDGLPEPYDQRTDAVTFDPASQLLYAQPRTVDAGGNLLWSQVASYSAETGADLEWTDLPLDVAAGGMAKVPGIDGLVLGVKSGLCQYDGGVPREVIDLQSIGVVNIDGLAVDEAAGTILVLDGEADQLFELDLASLR